MKTKTRFRLPCLKYNQQHYFHLADCRTDVHTIFELLAMVRKKTRYEKYEFVIKTFIYLLYIIQYLKHYYFLLNYTECKHNVNITLFCYIQFKNSHQTRRVNPSPLEFKLKPNGQNILYINL